MYAFNEIEQKALNIYAPEELYDATTAFVYSDEQTGVNALVQVNENSLADIAALASGILAAGPYDASNFTAGASIRIDEETHIDIAMDNWNEDGTGDVVECCICDYYPPEEMAHYPQARLICRADVFIPHAEHDWVHGGTAEVPLGEIHRVAYDAMMEGIRMYGTLA